MHQTKAKRILLTAGRSNITLDLARKLHHAGHQVYVTDTTKLHICYFSKAVCKTFLVPIPRFEPGEYVEKLIEIVTQEKIDLLIPIYEEIMYISKAIHLFPDTCKVFCSSFDVLNHLHNKWLFYKTLCSLQIETPRTYLIQSQEDLEKIDLSVPYALKASYSRASLSLIKLAPGRELPSVNVDKSNPWIAQEWIDGNRYCSYSICQDGQVLAHALYPVRFALDGNSCITFKSMNHPGIFEWITNLVKQLQFTGQIAFDFIENKDQQLYAIECNPRATSGIHLFSLFDRMEKAFFEHIPSTIFPEDNRNVQIATGMCLYGWKRSSYPNNTLLKFLKELFSTPDVVFDRGDLKPFLSQPLVFSGIWKNSLKYGISIPAAFTFDHEWNGEHDIVISDPTTVSSNAPQIVQSIDTLSVGQSSE
jgi:predicted ATP-grasp superfamily ATP-dependent carboligase